MAKPLVFQLGDRDLPFELTKVDRSKLYGYKTVEAIDSHGSKCSLATLANDGQTIVASGGTGLGYLNADGEWCAKTDLTPVDSEGKEIPPVSSSFNAPIKLFDTVTVDEYFQHNIKSIYLLSCDAEIEDLKTELARGTIFSFPFSYRGGLEADRAFLLSNEEGYLFMAVGVPTKTQWIGLQQTSVEMVDIEAIDEVEMMDFDMI